MNLVFNPCSLYDDLNHGLLLRFAGGYCVGFADVIRMKSYFMNLFLNHFGDPQKFWYKVQNDAISI